MYETICKKLTNIQDIKNNNQICYLLSKMTNSKPILTTDDKKVTMRGLGQMLRTRNKRYDYDQTTNPYGLPFSLSGASNIGRPFRHEQIKSQKKQNKDILIYQSQQLEDCLQNMCEQYCNFSLHSQINIQQESMNYHNQNSLTKITQGLRQYNLQQISKANTEIGSSIRLIRFCGMATPYFQQLVRQIELVKQNQPDGSIFLKIFQSFGASVSDASIYPHIEQLERKNNRKNDDKWKYILLVFLIDTPESRMNLKQYLFVQNESQIFQLIKLYDNFFDMSTPKQFQLKYLIEYSDRINTFRKKSSSIYCKKLSNLMNFQNLLNLQQQFGQFKFEFENFVVLGIIKTLKWLQIKFHQLSDTLAFYRIIFDNFKIIKSQLSKMLLSSPEPSEFQSLNHLKLMNYHESFSLIQNREQKLFLTLLICNQSATMEKLFIFQKNTYSFGEYQEVGLKKFQIQLVQQIKTNFFNHNHVGFIIDCTKFMSIQDKLDILLKSKSMVESIEWPHLCALTQKQQMRELMRDIILGSIKMYQNANAFLNTGIPIVDYLPKFQIQILIQGLIKVLTEDIKLNQKEMKKFFGMIEIFRGIFIQEQDQFIMTILQMLIEWYVLRQSMIQQDFKSLGQALKSNLQESSGERDRISNSVTLTQSTKGRASLITKVHNDAYIKKIGDSQFMQKISHHEQFQVLYVKFLHTVIQSICKTQKSHKMKIVKTRIRQWVETYIQKLNDNIKQSKGQFHKMLCRLRQKSFNLTALHKI